jgi:uncharacterized protein YcbX
MHITGIYIYPIKSCRGIALDYANVQDIGLEHDRRYMVIDAENTFLTQRNCPEMARIDVSLTSSGWALARVDMPTLRWEPVTHGPESTVQVWKDSVTVVDQGDTVAAWFSLALNRPCRLVGFASGMRRLVDQTYAVNPTDAVSFADGYASLLVTEESLADLNARTKEPVPMNRFRPNIVVAGARPWEEDNWRTVRIGSVEMVAVKKCARCVVTTTDQHTGERRVEPLHTLAVFRQIGHGLIFGQNMVHKTNGTIRIGDQLILE